MRYFGTDALLLRFEMKAVSQTSDVENRGQIWHFLSPPLIKLGRGEGMTSRYFEQWYL